MRRSPALLAAPLSLVPLFFPTASSLAAPAAPVFQPAERAVSTWRDEAAANLASTPARAAALRDGPAPPVARCVKLNNYWCIKKAGWLGEIASDGEGHVAFASAREGAAVAALLLKRYYVDLHRRSALAIVSRWAPPGCGGGGIASGGSLGTLTGIAGTLRARWLVGHGRGREPRVAGAPAGRAGRAITLDALFASTPGLPPSRSMIGQGSSPRRVAPHPARQVADPVGDIGPACPGDGARIAAYAARAAVGIAASPDDDLALFSPDGAPTGHLATLMGNMAAVEIGPMQASPALIEAGITDAFRPGRSGR